jgi:RHS repeat-associated protein
MKMIKMITMPSQLLCCNPAPKMDVITPRQVLRSGEPCYGTTAESGMPLFTGQVRDGETTTSTQTGLDYFGARYHWGALGRFTSPDPENAGADASSPGSWNMYSYAYNNPLSYTDPTGLGPCPVDSETGQEKPCIAGLLYEAWLRQQFEFLRNTLQATRAVTDTIQGFRNSPSCGGTLVSVGRSVGGALWAPMRALKGAPPEELYWAYLQVQERWQPAPAEPLG